MKTLLYLDDLRNPFFELPKHVIAHYKIVWVRNYSEFEKWITDWGLPHFASFDHDLFPEHYTPEEFWSDYESSKKYQEVAKQNYKEQTGEGCAKLLLTYCEESGKNIEGYMVHSANPIGADWIRKVLEGEMEIDIESL